MLRQIDHVGVAVEDIDAALELYTGPLAMPLEHRETVHDQGVDAALVGVGAGHVELLAPLGPDTPVGKYNPDWAIVKHDDQTLYLVRETKSTKDFLKLRTAHPLRLLGIGFPIAAFAWAASIAGTITFSVVPGKTVLRTTMRWNEFFARKA